MNATYEPKDCEACPGQYVCRCLQVTEAEVVSNIVTLGIRNLRELRRCTGAGEGCTSCHRDLQQLIHENAPRLAKAS